MTSRGAGTLSFWAKLSGAGLRRLEVVEAGGCIWSGTEASLDMDVGAGSSTGGCGGGGSMNHCVTGRSAGSAGSGVPTREPPRWMISDGALFLIVLQTGFCQLTGGCSDTCNKLQATYATVDLLPLLHLVQVRGALRLGSLASGIVDVGVPFRPGCSGGYAISGRSCYAMPSVTTREAVMQVHETAGAGRRVRRPARDTLAFLWLTMMACRCVPCLGAPSQLWRSCMAGPI